MIMTWEDIKILFKSLEKIVFIGLFLSMAMDPQGTE